MNIEKTECDRLGYEYASVLEHISYLCHHAPFIKDYINEETMKKFDDLCLKLATGDCEIIEFKRKLSSYDFTDVLEEKDKQINQLQSNWNSLREELKKHKDILNARWQQFASHKNQNKDILNRFESKIEEIDFILDKMNELEGEDNKYE